MPIINSILSWIMKQRIHQIELFIKYPHEVQEEWFRKLINAGRFSEWGRLYDYASIRTIKDYQERVPVQDYDSIKPYINRLRQGEQRLLWSSEVKWFAKSSGTTSDKSKFIPVTNEALEDCHFKGGKDLLSIYCNNHPETGLFNGKLLSLGGSHQINSFSNDSFYGDLSAILIQNLPIWIQILRTPEISIALMDEWESKIEMMAQATSREDVTNISGVPSWTLVLIKRILEITGKDHITEVWPNLELFIHGAVNFKPYKEQFDKLIPKSGMNYYETYNASEGFFGIQDRHKSEEMLLMLDYGIFYEFIPVEEINSAHPKVLTLSEVQLNENYAIVITSNAGLWRYKIGDTVTFTSLNPYRIRITGRTAHFINAFGEELIVENAERAIAETCKKSGAVVREYTASPVYFSDESCGANEWLIEFEKHPDDIVRFSELLDQELKNVNSDYEAKRYKNMALRPPMVKVMAENTFYNWLKSKEKLGGQHKVPRLSNNRKIVEEVLSFSSQFSI
ncbi:MAG TPA: GH3 auxin-responsive promoter family protein [Bacteroidia bacterium]|nr:GH3 auxin-responsive promoter family protein [Bacteroidia bacterium]